MEANSIPQTWDLDRDTDSTYPDRPTSDNCSINLNILQYIFYCSGKIDVLSPDDMLLETIGYGLKRSDLESSMYRLKEQLYLLECLLGNLNSNLEFTAQASTALADLLYRMQGFCRKYIG